MTRLTVTVDVDLNDITDVLAWRMYGLDAVQGPDARRWIERYVHASREHRDEVFRFMPPSLQWCVHEVESGREGNLRDILENHTTGESPRVERSLPDVDPERIRSMVRAYAAFVDEVEKGEEKTDA